MGSQIYQEHLQSTKPFPKLEANGVQPFATGFHEFWVLPKPHGKQLPMCLYQNTVDMNNLWRCLIVVS